MRHNKIDTISLEVSLCTPGITYLVTATSKTKWQTFILKIKTTCQLFAWEPITSKWHVLAFEKEFAVIRMYSVRRWCCRKTKAAVPRSSPLKIILVGDFGCVLRRKSANNGVRVGFIFFVLLRLKSAKKKIIIKIIKNINARSAGDRSQKHPTALNHIRIVYIGLKTEW